MQRSRSLPVGDVPLTLQHGAIYTRAIGWSNLVESAWGAVPGLLSSVSPGRSPTRRAGFPATALHGVCR